MSTTYEQERTDLQREIDAEILKRVKRGLKWLEEKHGPGWEDKIDLTELDLASSSQCVLGQVFDDRGMIYCGCGCGDTIHDGYSWALATYRIKRADKYGFDLADDEGGDDWGRLQRAWEYVLEPRVSHV